MKMYRYSDRFNIAGKNIREAREAHKLSQDQLAAKMQVEGVQISQRSISRAETGDRVIADFELKAFARVLAASVDSLLDEK